MSTGLLAIGNLLFIWWHKKLCLQDTWKSSWFYKQFYQNSIQIGVYIILVNLVLLFQPVRVTVPSGSSRCWLCLQQYTYKKMSDACSKDTALLRIGVYDLQTTTKLKKRNSEHINPQVMLFSCQTTPPVWLVSWVDCLIKWHGKVPREL